MDEAKYKTHINGHIHGFVQGENNTVNFTFQNNKAEKPLFPIWHVPYYRNPFFTGREYILKQLHDKLITTKTAALPQAISGLGGIGKTQVALEYAYRYQEEFNAVLWINAISRESILQDFTEIAEIFCLPDHREKSDPNKIITIIKRWFSMHDGWLLIFDNVDDLEMLYSFMPVSSKGYILFTTRLHTAGGLAHMLKIEKMDLHEGVQLLLHRVKLLDMGTPLSEAKAKDQTEAESIITELDGLPLAIDQAGAYIEETGCQLSSYLKQYKQRKIGLLKRRGINVDHPESVVTTWSLSFESIKQTSSLAEALIYVFAFLHPDSIPKEIILNGASHLGPLFRSLMFNPTLLDESIAILLRYSFIHCNIETDTFTIHRLVQVVVKETLNKTLQHRWAKRVVQAINQNFPEVTMETWKLCERYIPQVLTCAKLIKHYDLVSPEAARLLHQAAYYLGNGRALYIEAEPLFQQALTLYEHTLGSDNLNTATTLDNLGLLYSHQCKYDRAESFFQRALMIREKVLEPEDPAIAYSLNNLALLYDNFNKSTQAEPLFQRAQAIFEKTLKPDNPDTAIVLDNLGNLHSKRGKYEEAERFYQQAAIIFEGTLEPNHPSIAINLNNQAVLYESQGKYEMAEQFYLRVLTIRQNVLGSDHLDTASILNNLANLYIKQGKYELAEQFTQQALIIRKKVLEADHPSIGQSLNSQALYYHQHGKYEQAEPLYLQVLIIYQHAFGLNHTETATILNNLAGLYSNQGKYELAEPLYQQAIAIYQQVLGANHQETAGTINNLAGLYTNQGKYELAEERYQQALKIMELTLESDHPNIALTLNNVAINYQRQGKYDLAEALFKRILTIHEKVLGADHTNIVKDLHELGKLSYVQEKYDQAESMFQRALSICEKTPSLMHIDTAKSLNALGVLYSHKGKYDQAKDLLQRSLIINKEKLGSDHHNTQVVEQNYIKIIEKINKEIL
jgi:tetratricopeptide (TPR) repeat protein